MANKKAGCKNKYETHVLPFFDKIEKLLNDGATEKQVAQSLGISYPSFNNYKAKYKELDDLCHKPRVKLVEDLKGALVKRALGMSYEEKKVYITEDEYGKKKKHTEITTKTALPDPTSIFGALKIYDAGKLEYDIQSQNVDLKKQELELRKLQLENKEW